MLVALKSVKTLLACCTSDTRDRPISDGEVVRGPVYTSPCVVDTVKHFVNEK